MVDLNSSKPRVVGIDQAAARMRTLRSFDLHMNFKGLELLCVSGALQRRCVASVLRAGWKTISSSYDACCGKSWPLKGSGRTAHVYSEYRQPCRPGLEPV